MQRRHGISLIELLLVIGALVVLVWILASVMTGTSSTPGVKERAQRTIQAIDMRSVHQGFFTWAMDYQEKYPSTKVVGTRMDADTTSEVFRILVQDGNVAAQHLISPNEIWDFDYSVGNAGSFGPENTSFALCDYDADDWLRYRHWGQTQDSRFVLMSDRWVEHPDIPSHINNLQAEDDDPGFWNLLFNDGHSETTASVELSSGDHIFEYDSSFGDRDTLMVHD